MNKLFACALILCIFQVASAQFMCKLSCDQLIESCISNYHSQDVYVCKSLCNETLVSCIQQKVSIRPAALRDVGCSYNCDTLYNSCKQNCTNSQLCLGVCQAGKNDCLSRC